MQFCQYLYYTWGVLWHVFKFRMQRINKYAFSVDIILDILECLVVF